MATSAVMELVYIFSKLEWHTAYKMYIYGCAMELTTNDSNAKAQ